LHKMMIRRYIGALEQPWIARSGKRGQSREESAKTAPRMPRSGPSTLLVLSSRTYDPIRIGVLSEVREGPASRCHPEPPRVLARDAVIPNPAAGTADGGEGSAFGFCCLTLLLV
jgi:hypothetical protein